MTRPWGKVYVRYALRYLSLVTSDSRVLTRTLDVASIEVTEEYRSQGCFTRWLKQVELFCDRTQMITYVENVLEERFRQFFVKRGYVLADNTADFCYIRWPKLSMEDRILKETESVKQAAMLNE